MYTNTHIYIHSYSHIFFFVELLLFLLLSFALQHIKFFINVPDATVAVACFARAYIAEGLQTQLEVQSARLMEAVRSVKRF